MVSMDSGHYIGGRRQQRFAILRRNNYREEKVTELSTFSQAIEGVGISDWPSHYVPFDGYIFKANVMARTKGFITLNRSLIRITLDRNPPSPSSQNATSSKVAAEILSLPC